MKASPKRHPSKIKARFGCDADGRLQAVAFDATFDTGAYASWGPTVASRVPIHATGPYAVAAVSARGRAIYTNGPPAGAFRGFGVPQAAIAHEALMDDLADGLGIDRLEIRLRNALRAGDTTATGQVLEASAGLAPCLEALKPRWQRALEDAIHTNADSGRVQRGVGIGCMWYGIGNTALSNPSAMRITLDREGRLTLFNGAVDIGQGSTTILAQICADALGVAANRIAQVIGDTDWTEDAGKTSASRQTFVSGKAVESLPAPRSAPRSCARPMPPTTPRSSLRARRSWSATAGGGWSSTSPGSGPIRQAWCWKASAASIRRPRRSTPRARARPTRPMPSAPRSPWSMWTPSSGP